MLSRREKKTCQNMLVACTGSHSRRLLAFFHPYGASEGHQLMHVCACVCACVFVRTFEHACVSLFLYMCYSASEENLLSVPLSSSAVPAALYYLSAAEVK